jgi:WD40 repeat protein
MKNSVKKVALSSRGLNQSLVCLIGVIFSFLSDIAFSSECFAGPTVRPLGRGDRFIADRLTHPGWLDVRQLKFEGFFDSCSDDVQTFIRQDTLSRHLLGVSLNEGKNSKVLSPSSALSRSSTQLAQRDSRDWTVFLKERNYHVEPSVLIRYDAPGFINNSLFRVMDGNQGDFVVALEAESDDTGTASDDIYFVSNDPVPGVGPVLLTSSNEPISFMKWLSKTELFIGKYNGSWTLLRVKNPKQFETLFVFDAPTMATSLGLEGRVSLSHVIGVQYFESQKLLLVGYSDGKFLRVDLASLSQSPQVALSTAYEAGSGVVRFEFSSNHEYVAVATKDHGVWIHEWPSFRLVDHFTVSDGSVRTLSWHPQKQWLAIGTGKVDHRVYVYSPLEKKVLLERDVKLQVADMAWSAMGSELVIGLDYPHEEGVQVPESFLLILAIVADSGVLQVKTLGGGPQVKGPVLSIFLDTREKNDRVSTRVHYLSQELDGCVASMRYSRMKSSHEIKRSRLSASSEGRLSLRLR